MAKKGAQRDNLKQFRADIEAAKKEFALITRELIKFKNEGKTAAEITELLGNRVENLREDFKTTTESIKEFQGRFSVTTQKSKQATNEIKGLNGQMKSLDSFFGKTSKSADTFGQAFRKQFSAESLGKATGNLLKYVGAFKVFNTVLNLFKNTIIAGTKANIEFEAELAKLEAVTTSSSEEMEMLSDNILQVAGNTKFTSSEIVKLQTALGKLGFSTQEIIDSTQAIANVAQALGEDAAPVAEKVGQILNQFNLTASESVMVGDVLVSTINNSALSFESFGTAIQYVGPLAAELGTSFVELSGAMAILADNGFTASRIGTGLRGVLTELGTSGRDLESIIRKLADEEISFAEAVELVGKRSAAQLITLVDNIDLLEEAETRYEQTGAAIIASAKQIDTFKGNTELLNSAWNAFLINLGEFYNRAGLVKAALRLLDSEAANTAEGLSLIADVSPEVIATGIDAAVNKFEELNKKGEDFEEIMLQARTATAFSIADEILKGDEKMLDLLDRQVEYSQKLQDDNMSLQERNKVIAELNHVEKEIADLREETVKNINAAMASEVRQQVENAAIQSERNKIAEEYADTFEGLVDKSEKLKELAQEQKLSEKERGEFNVQIEKELNGLKEEKAKIEQGELKALKLKQSASIELSDEEQLRLKVLEGQVEAYDTQIGKFRNLLVFMGKQKKESKGAEENFNEQIDSLKRSIDIQKQILKDRIETNKVIREGLENQLASAKSYEEEQEILGRIKRLETSSLMAQKSSYMTIIQLINDKRDSLMKAGLTAEETEKALQKIADIEFKAGDLDIDIQDFAKAAERLSKDFKEVFGEGLKKGEELTEDQKEFVEGFMSDLLSGFENLTEEDRNALSELILSALFADTEEGERIKEKKAKELEKSIDDAIKKTLDKILDKLEEQRKSIIESAETILDELGDVFDEYNETYLENKTSRLEAELDAVQRAADIEQEILSAQLNNQLITEGQFRTKSLELRKVAIAKENSLNKQIFEAEKAADLRTVGAETAEALASNILNNYEKYDFNTAGVLAILATLAIGAAGLAKADAIRQRQFTPVQFEQGGMVHGPSHAQGGVPFTVQGRGGYEMEGGEFIVNKRASAMHRDLLERINGSSRSNTPVGRTNFALGGIVEKATAFTGIPQVKYLKEIAENTATSAINTGKPVRAFVSSKDLRANENERRLRDRNDKI